MFDSEYCMEHWKEDWFFGYQCLNGSNPRMIQRCKKIPENFPVTSDMVQSSMAPRTNLDKELKVEKCTVLSISSRQALSNLCLRIFHLSPSMSSIVLIFLPLSCPGRKYLLVRLRHHGWDSHQHNQGKTSVHCCSALSPVPTPRWRTHTDCYTGILFTPIMP